MKIILDQMEFDLPESIFRLVENAHLTGKVKKALEISKYRWNFQIKFDDSLVECEIKYGKNCVTKIHCACGRSNSKHPCIHSLIAAYWYYKEVYLQKKIINTQSIKSSFELNSEDYTNLELGTFINFCFKLDKNLKKWAELLLSKNLSGIELYKFIYSKLEDMEKTAILTSRNSIVRSYREQCEILQSLYDQSIIDFTYGNIEQAIYKSFASLLKSNQWLSVYKNNNHSKLQNIHANIHSAFDQMLQSIKAADLIETLFEFINSELNLKPYSIFNYHNNLYVALLNHYNNHAYVSKNDGIIIENLKNGVLQKLNEAETVVFILKYFKNTNSEFIYSNELITSFNSQTWLVALQKLEDLELISDLEATLQILFDKIPVQEIRNRIAELILKHLISSGNIKVCAKKAKQFAIQLSKINFAIIYFECIGFNTAKIKLFVEDYCKHHSTIADEFILDLLSKTNEAEILLAALEKIESVNLLMKYDHKIFKQFPKQLILKYFTLAEEYLNNHAGQQAFIYVDEIKKHISKVGLKSHAEEFLNAIQCLYPERTKIINYI